MFLRVLCALVPKIYFCKGDEALDCVLVQSWDFRIISFVPEKFQKQPSRGVFKIYSKFRGEHPSQSVISINLQSNFIEITLRHGCSPINFLYIFRIPVPKNISGRLLLKFLMENKRWNIVNGSCTKIL